MSMTSKPDRARERHRLLDGHQFAIGEHVPLEEPVRGRSGVGTQPAAAATQAGEAMVEEQPARAERLERRTEIGRQVGPADVLEHADGRDAVELAEVCQIAVVAYLRADRVTQPGCSGTVVRRAHLPFAQCDADGLATEPLAGVRDERTPARADVQQSDVLAQLQLPADEVQLGLLGVVEPSGRVRGRAALREIGAGVGHAPIQPQRKEVVANVVVEADRGHVSCAAMASSGHPRDAGERLGTRRAAPQFPSPAPEAARIRWPEPSDIDRLAGIDGCRDVALDLQVAPQEPIREAVRIGRANQTPERIRTSDHHGRP